MKRFSVSMTDVAREAGVSLGTVSNVVNRPEKVAEGTRARVEEVIVRLGFVPDGRARSLSSGTSSSIGFVVVDLSNSFFLDMARGAEQEAARWGMKVLLANADRDWQRERTYLDLFEEERFAGVLLAPAQEVPEGERVGGTRRTPLVVLNDTSRRADAPAVDTDNEQGGYLAARHLVELGRRRLLFAGPDAYPVVRQRLAGVRRAVTEAGGAVALDRFDVRGVRVEDGRRVGEHLLDLPADRRPDAVLAGADLLALGLVQTLTTDGRVVVPDDVAVVGYDNNTAAWDSIIPITTVDQDGAEMGGRAARMLVDLVRGGRPESDRVVLGPRLVVRQSTVRR